jgi:hypothetical protein
VGWANHPATRMWTGHVGSLLDYQEAVCVEWVSRGYADTCLAKTQYVIASLPNEHLSYFPPKWFGDEAFHASHRSNLLRKDPEWYGQFGWAEPDDLEYVWPRV